MTPSKGICSIPITVEVPRPDVWVRNDYRDIVRRLGEVHLIRGCERQFDDDFVPLYDLQTVAEYQIESEKLKTDLAAALALLADAELMLQECEPWLDQYANTAKLKADTHKVRLRIVDAMAGKDAT